MIEAEDRHTRPLADWLAQQRKGALNVEAGEALAELADKVRETRKGGKVTIEITVSPGPGTSLKVSDEVKVKAPSHDREVALWFADDSGLTRRDPDQEQLNFPRVVDPVTGEIHDQEKRA